jgi:hypothetical protein
MDNGIFNREYPVLRFGITSYKADHSQDILLIETKYFRAKRHQVSHPMVLQRISRLCKMLMFFILLLMIQSVKFCQMTIYTWF